MSSPLPPRSPWLRDYDVLRDRLAREESEREAGDVALLGDYASLNTRLLKLEARVAELEEPERPSIVANTQQALVDQIIAKLDSRREKSEPPDVEYTTASGSRIRGNGWPFALVAIVALLITLILRGPQFLEAVVKQIHTFSAAP